MTLDAERPPMEGCRSRPSRPEIDASTLHRHPYPDCHHSKRMSDEVVIRVKHGSIHLSYAPANPEEAVGLEPTTRGFQKHGLQSAVGHRVCV